MPPFRDKEEKREYILEHRHLFEKLGIKLTDEKVQELVDDESKYERYEQARKEIELEEKREKEAPKAFGKHEALKGLKIEKVLSVLYDPADTQEALKWNGYVYDLANAPDAPKKIGELLLRGIIEYDDSVLAESNEDTYKSVLKNRISTRIMKEGPAIMEGLRQIYDMNNPKEATLINAAEEKYKLSAQLDEYNSRKEYEATKLSTILPDMDHAKAEELLNEQNKANGFYSVESKESLIRLLWYKDVEKKHNTDRLYNQQLKKLGLVGKDSVNYKVYRVTSEGKKYIGREDLIKALKENKGLDKIKYEELSLAERDALRGFRNSNQKIGVEPVWESKAEKRKFLELMRPALTAVHYDLTDEKINQIVDDDSRDVYTLRAREIAGMFEKPSRDFGIDTSNKTAPRLIQALYVKGDRPEDREWNEKIEVLSQTPEGIAEMARVAAKRLLAVPMEVLTNNDMNAMTDYLLEHPVERQLFILSANVTEAYESTLKPEEVKDDPVLRALKDRKLLLEKVQRVQQSAVIDGSRIANVIPDLSLEQTVELLSGKISREVKKADPAGAKLLREALQDIQNKYEYEKDLVPNAPVEGEAKKTKSVVDATRELYKENVLTDDIKYKTIHAKIVEKDEHGVAKPAVEKAFTITEMIEAVANGDLKPSDFILRDIAPEAKTKIDNFLKDTPDDLKVEASEKELNRLREMKYIREYNLANEGEIRMASLELEDHRKTDPEYAALADACAKNDSEPSVALQASFEYLNTHRHPLTEYEHKKFDLALMTLASVDGNCAKKLVQDINKERKGRIYFDDPTIDYAAFLKKTKIKPTTDINRVRFDVDNPFDKRLANIKGVYEHLDKDLDPFYHKNGDDFKAMMQSMKNIKDYLTTTKKPDKTVVESMINKVKETSKTYLTNNNNPWTYLGKNRACAALAAIAAIDPAEGELQLQHVCAEKRQWARQLCNVVGKSYETITSRDVLNREKLTGSPKEEILEKINADLVRSSDAAAKASTIEEKSELFAQYFAKKKIFDLIKGENLDKQEIVDLMSKNTIKAAGSDMAKNDVYRKLINSLRTSQDSELNKSIDKLEKEFLKLEKADVEAKEAAKAAKVEVEEAKKKAPEINNPVVGAKA